MGFIDHHLRLVFIPYEFHEKISPRFAGIRRGDTPVSLFLVCGGLFGKRKRAKSQSSKGNHPRFLLSTTPKVPINVSRKADGSGTAATRNPTLLAWSVGLKKLRYDDARLLELEFQ